MGIGHGISFATATASSRRASDDRVEVIDVADANVILVADGAGGVGGGSAASDAFLHAARELVALPGFDASDVGAWTSASSRSIAGA